MTQKFNLCKHSRWPELGYDNQMKTHYASHLIDCAFVRPNSRERSKRVYLWMIHATNLISLFLLLLFECLEKIRFCGLKDTFQQPPSHDVVHDIHIMMSWHLLRYDISIRFCLVGMCNYQCYHWTIKCCFWRDFKIWKYSMKNSFNDVILNWW